MSGEPSDVIIEHLNALRSEIAAVKTDTSEIRTRLGQVETGLAGVRRDFAHADENTAILSVRLDRLIERRSGWSGAWNSRDERSLVPVTSRGLKSMARQHVERDLVRVSQLAAVPGRPDRPRVEDRTPVDRAHHRAPCRGQVLPLAHLPAQRRSGGSWRSM